MSDEQQPRAEWIFPEQKKSRKGRIWLIIGLVVAVIAIAAVLLFFLIPRGGTPGPDSSASPSPSLTPSASPSPSDSTEPEPEPSTDPTPPPAPDPDLETFTSQVQPRLADATRGLDLVQDNMDVGAQIVDSLQQDADVLSDTAAPSSMADDWSAAVSEYAGALKDLRAALDGGSEPQAALDAARAALSRLNALIEG